MKRFIADMLLVFILVAIGSSIMEEPTISIEKQLYDFEHQLEDEWYFEDTFNGYEIVGDAENHASRLAKKSSEFIHDSVEIIVKTVASLFSIFID